MLQIYNMCGRSQSIFISFFQGPESEPEANCNYFQWASVKSKLNRKRNS